MVVLDDVDHASSGPHSVKGRGTSQTSFNLEPGFKTTGMGPEEGVENSKGHRNKTLPDIQDVGPRKEEVCFDKLRNTKHGLQKEYDALNAACAAEKATLAKSLLEGRILWVGKVTQKWRVTESLCRLVEKLSVRECSVADKRYMEDALTTKEMLIEQVKHLSGRLKELMVEKVNEKS